MVQRRTLLRFSPALVLPTTGCTGQLSSGDESDASLPENGKRRGESSPMNIVRNTTHSGDEYVPQNDTVRYLATKSEGAPDEYRYAEFEEWAHVEAAEYAVNRLQTDLHREFNDLHLVSVSIVATGNNALQVVVTHRTEVNDTGEIVESPPASVNELLDLMPKRIESEVHLGNETYAGTYPGFVSWGRFNSLDD